MRSGADLYADSVEFKAAFRVTVSSNCKDSPNLIFTAAKIPTLVATANAGVPNVTLSCADAPGTVDYLLTPTDVQNITAIVTAMNAHINDLATQHGWAVVDLNAVLATAVAKRPAAYSVVRQMTCVLPYGPYIGLDGVHPIAAGHVKLANAAITAIDAKYGFTIPQIAEGTNANPCP